MSDLTVEHAGAPVDHTAQIAQVPRISIQAFCESTQVAEAIDNAAAGSPHVKGAYEGAHGRVSAAIEAFRSAPTPNLIVIEIDEPYGTR